MAQKVKEQHRSVSIERVVVDGKVVRSDTVIITNDTVPRNIKSKEINKELPYAKGTTVHVEVRYRKINIRRSGDNKVRLSTTVFYEGAPAFTDEQWLDKLNIKMQQSDSGVNIISGGTGPVSGKHTTVFENSSSRSVTTTTSYTSSASATASTVDGKVVTSVSTASGTDAGGSSVAVFNEKGAVSYRTNSLKQELTLYVPAAARLDLNTVYADVSADHDLPDVNVKITNADLDMMNAGHLIIVCNYGNISAGNIGDGRISITNGKLSMKDAGQLIVDSRHSKIDAVQCDSLQLKSMVDDYDIDEVRSLVATKSYGSLKIGKLTGSLDLKGTSADVKIRKITPTVSAINIDDRYADVALPVTELKNYQVAFDGDYSNVFAPFEKVSTVPEKQTSQTTTIANTTAANGGSGTTATASSVPPGRNGRSFTATVGNMNDAPTIFKLVCNSCSLDFK